MKVFRLFFIALLLGIFVGAILGRLRSAPEASNPPAEAKPKTIEAPQLKKIEPSERSSARVPTTGNPAEEEAFRPEGNEVRFKIVNGMAIAFGDVLLGTPEQEDLTEGYYVASPPQLWDKNEIPYSIEPNLPNPERVKQAIEYFHQNTSVRFIPYRGQPDALIFSPGNDHCYSMLGRTGGMQPVYLNADCEWQHIAHEMMHALGFSHEQSRTDRDQYVKIQWENVDAKYRSQFDIVPESFMDSVKDSPFDYQSIMLYEKNAFAKLPELLTMKTLTALDITPVKFGLSASDLQRLSRLYRK